MSEIELGDTVKCIYTGFTGVAVSKTEFVNGCTQYEVAGKVCKDFPVGAEVNIDEGSLKVIKKKIRPIIEEDTLEESNGGPRSKPIKQRGF